MMGREWANSFILLYDVLIYCRSKEEKGCHGISLETQPFLSTLTKQVKDHLKAQPDPAWIHFTVAHFELNWSVLSPAAVDTRPLCLPAWSSLSVPLSSFFPLSLRSLLADAPYSLALGPSVRESNSHPVIIRFAGVPTVSASISVSFWSTCFFLSVLCLWLSLIHLQCQCQTVSIQICVFGHFISIFSPIFPLFYPSRPLSVLKTQN